MVFCPRCARPMVGPASPDVPYPIFVCALDGVVFDRRRDLWHGLGEIGTQLACPVCGRAMEFEPKEPPARVFFCYQCGTTFDRAQGTWFGLAYHQGP